jgi:hypothetical protein
MGDTDAKDRFDLRLGYRGLGAAIKRFGIGFNYPSSFAERANQFCAERERNQAVVMSRPSAGVPTWAGANSAIPRIPGLIGWCLESFQSHIAVVRERRSTAGVGLCRKPDRRWRDHVGEGLKRMWDEVRVWNWAQMPGRMPWAAMWWSMRRGFRGSNAITNFTFTNTMQILRRIGRARRWRAG